MRIKIKTTMMLMDTPVTLTATIADVDQIPAIELESLEIKCSDDSDLLVPGYEFPKVMDKLVEAYENDEYERA